ncbi:MAG: TolC family protein [Draconibacterium sp.]|nr:TolC family protein [Draconibacterium sp.]
MKVLIKLAVWLLFLSPVNVFGQQHDPNFYIEKARVNSPFIHKNQNEKRIIKLDLEQLKSIYSKPEVTVDAGVLFAPIISHDNNRNQLELVANNGVNYTGYDMALTDGGQYQAFLSVKQGLFNSPKLQTYSEKAGVQDRISDNNIELTEHELENVVNHQYILCLKSEKQAENSLALIKEVDDELKVLQKLVESAIYNNADLMLLQITRQNYFQEHELYLAEYKNNLYNLNLLCGIDDNSDIKIKDIEFKQKPIIGAKSLFLTSFFLDSLSIASNQKIRELKYKPQVNLFANTGMNAVYLPSINRLGFSTGVTFSLTIFDGNQRNIEREKTEINLQTLEFEKEKSITQNTIQKNYTLSQINSLNKRILLANNQLEQYNELLKIYKVKLGQAEISVMDFKYLIKEISVKKQESSLLEMEKQIVINAYNYWDY